METTIYSLNDEEIGGVERICREAWTDLYQKKSFCDAVLKTEDGGIFEVHKSVLAPCSPFFETLLSKEWTDPIPGVTKEVMKDIIAYCYSGKAVVCNENILDLLIGADRLSVNGLLEDCANFLLCNLSIHNCIKMRQFAKMFYCFDLEDEADRFLMSNFIEVSKSNEFLELSVDEATDLLNSDRVNVQSEEQVWEAGLRWIDHRPEERKRHIDRILRCVRLGLLDNQYFMDKVKTHEYIENNDVCKSTIIETLRFHWDLEIISQKAEAMETPFLAIPRLPGSILFAIGGWSGGAPTDFIETYDTKADRWVVVKETDPVGPRAYHKLAVIGHDIYVIGGFNGVEYFNGCRCFSAVTKKWKDIAPMHSKRCYVSVAVLDDLIYAIGGYDGHRRQNTVERYDYRTNQWTFVSPMNVQRSDACATTLNGFIYIAGGFSGIECLSTCEYYYPTIDQWTTIMSMRMRRSGLSVISHHGKIYALGGFNGISRLSSGERYDPSTGEWSDVPDMFNPRSNFAIEIMDDMIFAIGGFNGVSTTFNVECFEESKNEWYEATDMTIYRSALAACVVHQLPKIDDYIHKDRKGLIEEKRQRLLRQRNMELTRALVAAPPAFPQMILGGQDAEDGQEWEDIQEDEEEEL